MKARRWVVLVMLVACGTMVGCVSTPEGYKVTPEAGEAVDQGVAVVDSVAPVITPFATAVPYGNLAIALIVGAAGMWAKVRPHLVAEREMLAGIKAGKPAEANADDEMAKATSDGTKAIMAKAGV
jgi:hypothetical protein